MQTIMREFRTKHFIVRASIEPDYDVDTSFDETGETAEKIADGEWEAFQTEVVVLWNGAEIGADYLGGSIYADPRDFFKEHIGIAAKSRADGCNYGCYFSDMVREAISEARNALQNVPQLRKIKGDKLMPEYHLPTDNAGAEWHKLDAFTQGFIEAAFFCDASCYGASEFFEEDAQEAVREGQADGSIPSDAGPEDIEPKSLKAIADICRQFQAQHAALLALAYACDDYDEPAAGRDFYYTRAGHGVGYWDRDQLKAIDDDAEEYERLTALMVASRDADAWNTACAAREILKARSLGARLTRAAGRHEINLDAYEDANAPSGFFVSFYC